MVDQTLWYRSLVWKLLLLLLLIGLLPLFFFADTVINPVEDYFMSQREQDLLRTANITAHRVLTGNYISNPDLRHRFRISMEQRSLEEGVRILILDTKGVVLIDTSRLQENNTLLIPEVINVFRDGYPSSHIQPDGINRYTAVSIIDENLELIGVVLLVSSVQDINDLIEIISGRTGLLNLATAGFALLSAIFVSYLVISPLKRLLNVVEKMSAGHLGQRVKITGNNEFSQLCKAFNNMNEKLERVEKTREEFVSNVSHELKTPLSSIKVLSESILTQENVSESTYREFLNDINSEVNRMDRIINDLLTLVKLDQTTSFLNMASFNISAMTDDIIKRLKPLADLKEINLTKIGRQNIRIIGDEMKLTLAISNLVENSIKYTMRGGKINISLNTDNQYVYIAVQDTGIGISPDEQSKIFDRFYRVDKTRDRDTGGTGLGLSITHTTILLHKGSIKVDSREGKGAVFTVRLPIETWEAV